MRKAHQLRLSAIALSGLLAVVLLSVAAIEAKADISATHTREMASLSGERFKLPDPMSREYAQPSRFQDTSRQIEVPVDEKSPAKPRPKPETN
jgi:hypothetical protein